MNDLHLLSAILGYAALALYFWRTGTLLEGLPASERIARGGVGLVLAAVALGLSQRAGSDDPFLWFHWLLLGGLAAMVGGYVGLIIHSRPR